MPVKDLSEAVFWSGTAMLISSLSLALLSPLWGWLTSRIGSKRMLMRVLISNAAVLILISISTNVYQLLALKLLEGILTGTGTIVMTIIALSVEQERLPQAIGVQQSIQTAGALIGPGIGAILATLFGFRYCFLLGGLLILAPIPVVMWARLENRKLPTIGSEKINFQSIKSMRFDLIALFAIQAAFIFISPILPLYLHEVGLTGKSLVETTGAILFLSGLAYAVSVPFTTRLFKIRTLPLLLCGASVSILLQGLIREPIGFTALRMLQCLLISAAPALIFGKSGGSGPNKGFTVGMLNSARLFGSAIGPFLASTAAYAANVTFSFIVITLISIVATLATLAKSERKN